MRAAIVLVSLAAASNAFAQANGWQNVALSLQGLAASAQLSVSSTQLSAATRGLSAQCRQDRDCDLGSRCEANDAGIGRCVRHDCSQSEQSQGSGLVLRDRAVQLREELALGRGPVTTWLASTRGISPVVLGRAMRSHRSELVLLIGDAASNEWTTAFLRRVDELAQS